MEILQFAVLVLAAWRIALLLSMEKGPWDLCEKLRIKLGVDYSHGAPVATGFVSQQILCVWCSSLWIGLLFAVLGAFCLSGLFWACVPFAVSAAVILLQVSRPIQHYIDKLGG